MKQRSLYNLWPWTLENRLLLSTNEGLPVLGILFIFLRKKTDCACVNFCLTFLFSPVSFFCAFHILLLLVSSFQERNFCACSTFADYCVNFWSCQERNFWHVQLSQIIVLIFSPFKKETSAHVQISQIIVLIFSPFKKETSAHVLISRGL